MPSDLHGKPKPPSYLRSSRSEVPLSLGAVLTLAASVGMLAILATSRRQEARRPVRDRGSQRNGATARPWPENAEPVTHRAARQLNHASSVLAFSVLADSGLEHYRGQFFNRAMYTPLAVSSLVLAVNTHGIVDRSPGWSGVRHAVQVAAGLTGLVGLGFHAYNVGKREGGYSWLNLFYAAPLGAPFALTMAGMLGAAAEHVRDADPEHAEILGLPAGSLLAAGTAVGLLGTAAEAGLLHFRGAYHNPFMYAPVTMPPATAALAAWAAFGSSESRVPTRWMLRATTALGLAGVAFHALGVARNMGGWRNWSQNILNGPPLPAPPSFTGIALAGFAALDLLEARHG